MKTKFPSFLCLLGAAAIGAPMLPAQDSSGGQPPPREEIRPPASDSKPRPPSPQKRRDGPDKPGPRGNVEQRGRGAQPEGKLTPYIGVITRELSDDVRTHAGVPEGFGLIVTEIMPDSPAAQAGLQRHDVLVQLDDQKLVNMEQLMTLVRSRKKGDELTLTAKRGGEELKFAVTLGERVMPPMQENMEPDGYRFFPMPFGGDRRFERPFEDRGIENPGEFKERLHKFQNEMREFQERIQDWSRGPRDKPMPQVPRLDIPNQGPREQGPPRMEQDKGNNPPRGDKPDGRTESRAETRVSTDGGRVITQGSIVRRDDSGEYSIRRDNDHATFTVRPKDGKEMTWPINTEEERKAVPEQYREILKDLDKIHLDSNQGRGSQPPADQPPERKPAPNKRTSA